MPHRGWALALVCLLTIVAPLGGPSGAAHEATPGAGAPASGMAGGSISREEYARQLAAEFDLEEPGHRGGSVVVGQSSDIADSLNPLLAGPSTGLLGQVFEALVGTSALDGRPVPALADSWELAPDGVTYTFHLNEAARWHDETDLTAADVVFSFDAALDPAINSPYTGTLARAVASYRARDPDTFEVQSEGKLATFLYDVGYVPILAEHVWGGIAPEGWWDNGGSTGEDPDRVVGTGPFRFEEWDLGDHATLVRHDGYHGVVPAVDAIVARVLPDQTAAVQALRAGDVDIVDWVPAGQVRSVEDAAGLAVAVYDTTEFVFHAYNLDPAKTPLFQQREVRQALFLALDREAIVDVIFQGLGEPAIGTQPLLSGSYAPERMATEYGYDPEAARRLLAEAGWTDADGDGVVERGGENLRFRLSYTPGEPEHEQLVAYLLQAWAEVGAAVTPEPMPFAELAAVITETRDFDVALLGFSWDATGDQGAMFGCEQYEGGFNVMRYCNPRYDELQERQRRELDPTRRRELQIELANIVNDDLPIWILLFSQTATGYRDALRNFYPNGYGLWWSLPYLWSEG